MTQEYIETIRKACAKANPTKDFTEEVDACEYDGGVDVTLADVLYAIEGLPKTVEFRLNGGNEFCILEEKSIGSGEREVVGCGVWNLLLPLETQSEECLKFISELLKEN